MIIGCCLLFLLCIPTLVQSKSIQATAKANNDLITNLPGLTFNPGFAQYSGYLQTPAGNSLHYWFVEAQNKPETAPLQLWLNGGPGCSSLGGLFTELGPFRVNQDGRTLFENVFSWNKGANVLFLEAPRGVGFSYRNKTAPPDNIWDDTKTAEDNADAIAAFLDRFPQYNNRSFYLTGESYAGVYVPTLANVLIKRIQAGKLKNLNLTGMAIGNGILSEVEQTNSVIDLFYYRGMLGMDQYDSLQECCLNEGHQPLAYCNFSQYLNWTNQGAPNVYNNNLLNECAQKIAAFSDGDALNDPYNSYQDCYMDPVGSMGARAQKMMQSRRRFMKSMKMRAPNAPAKPFVDQAAYINIGSTDAQYGFPCWMDQATYDYLNLPEVRQALHIPLSVQTWTDCNSEIFPYYIRQHYNMMPVFNEIIGSGYKLSILIYNGDADTVCNFLGDEWFILRLAKIHQFQETSRTSWTYQQNKKYPNQLAGYVKQFKKGSNTIDLLTVKGAGHFVPLDRAGPSLQMITSFVQQNSKYSGLLQWDITPKTILPAYQPLPTIEPTRKEHDRIWYLPGLTFEPNFKHYSGYLNGGPGDYLFYWFVESQRDPTTDPLVLWLNGGPGCSSIGGFFSENGPFYPNPDNKTLFENPYAWNKMANVIYLESPRMVGFSWQNKSINTDTTWDDAKTARNSFLALMDFLTVFPEYINRPFYITGESYAGIYIPTLTAYTIKQIQAGNAPGLNFTGIAIGNGELSMLEQINSIIAMLYYRGTFGFDRFHMLQSCCPNHTEPAVYCDYSKFLTIDKFGNASPINNSECAKNIVKFGNNYIWDHQDIQDVYNLYEDGYRQYPSGNSANVGRRKAPRRSRNMQIFQNLNQNFDPDVYTRRAEKINYDSTDGKGNFYWYEDVTAPVYLNTPDVRKALHVPEYVQEWADCSDIINTRYIQNYNDTTPQFTQIFESAYPLRILIYNGDVDTACQFLGDEWFIEKMAKQHKMATVRKRVPWQYESEFSGYYKRFKSPIGSLDLATVKGAGHFVPLDRPGPMLQMIHNFINNLSYSVPLPFSIALKPIKEEYAVKQKIAKIEQYNEWVKTNDMKKQSVLPQAANVNELPGISFNPKFEQSTGLLPSNNRDKLFYWWMHMAPKTRPLIIWLGDRPGCSVLHDVVSDMGPYRLCPHGISVFENPYAWTQAADLLFLEASPGVGFSQSNNEQYTDDMVVTGLTTALQTFITNNANNQEFYIFGKGYGAIYALLLAKNLLKTSSSIAKNLQGIGLNNALLNYNEIINTFTDELYFSGLLGKSEWDELIPCCMKPDNTYDNHCNLSQYVHVDSSGKVWANDYPNNAQKAQCANLVSFYAFKGKLMNRYFFPTGNMYRSCYSGVDPRSTNNNNNKHNDHDHARSKRDASHLAGLPLTNNNSFIEQTDRMNYRSTDAFASYPCYMNYASDRYFNSPNLQKFFGVSMQWNQCTPNYNYTRTYFDMAPILQEIDQYKRPLRVLLFDGDSHIDNNFVANIQFIAKCVYSKMLQPVNERNAWTYQAAAKWLPQYSGFVKKLNSTSLEIDLVTVKGAGRMIGLDRPAPNLQMISNFLNKKQYNNTVELQPMQPMKSDFKPPTPVTVTRMTADQIWNLPGLTYKINFNQYSGYLKASPGNYLHYWFVESQNNPSNDPVIIWFTGGPGCSSVGALFTENGPFLINSDSVTLFENVFSWNKLANVLYIESPRGVGFSYQDTKVNPSQKYNDNLTMTDAYLAIIDFFSVYEQFRPNDLYITGESYGGVYVPTLTAYIIEQIQVMRCNLTLKGMTVGNGDFSDIMNIRSIPNFLYFHGIYGKAVWDKLQKCCPGGNTPITQCPFEEYVTISSDGTLNPIRSRNATVKHCSQLVVQLAQDRVWNTKNYVYNLYQSCYQLTENILPFGTSYLANKFSELSRTSESSLRLNIKQLHAELSMSYMKSKEWSVYTGSSDALGGFPCYAFQATTRYLNQAHVRNALHIPDYVQSWSFCSNSIDYTKQYNDTTPAFEYMLKSNYPLRVLIYNGDLDTACSMFLAEWFIEGFAKNNQMTPTERESWLYQLASEFEPQTGGYRKRFYKNNLAIDLITVKGAGHMVPTDRAGPMLQLLTNFVRHIKFNNTLPFSYQRQPLLPQYMPRPNIPTTNTSSTIQSSTTSTASTSKVSTATSKNSTVTITSTTKPSITTTTTTTTATTTTTPKADETTTTPKKAASIEYSLLAMLTLTLLAMFN